MLSVKAAAQNVLKYVHLYERAKVSRLYDLYWRIADRRIIYRREREIEFYRNLLRGFRKGDLIFDIGANNGLKTEIFFRLGATVIAVDPDEANQRALTDKFLKFRSAKKRVLVVGKAISDKNGFATFWIDRPGSNMNTLNEKWVETLRIGENRFGRRIGFDCSLAVETITLESLIQQYGFPFFVKIDVEGHEVKVLKGLRRPVVRNWRMNG